MWPSHYRKAALKYSHSFHRVHTRFFVRSGKVLITHHCGKHKEMHEWHEEVHMVVIVEPTFS